MGYLDIIACLLYFTSEFQMQWCLSAKKLLNISVKSRSNNDQESPGMAELQPFLDPNADSTFNGVYWGNVQGILKTD